MRRSVRRGPSYRWRRIVTSIHGSSILCQAHPGRSAANGKRHARILGERDFRELLVIDEVFRQATNRCWLFAEATRFSMSP